MRRKHISIVVKKSMSLFLLCLAWTVCGLNGAAVAEEKKPFLLSPVASCYFPTSGKTKDAFGSSWSGIGITFNPEALGWENSGFELGGVRLYPYMGYFHADEGDNDAHIIPVGLEFRWELAEGGTVRPYAGLGLAGYGVKFEDRDAGVDSGWKAAFGGRVMLGMDVTRWLNIQADYNLISDVKGYDFSGFSLHAKINLYF